MKAVNFGIDLGTTNSLIAKYENGQAVLFKNPVGHKESLASVVAFRKDRTLVGDKAREYLLKDAVNVFGGFKRRMGTDDRFYVVNIDENVTPVELSAYVLKELKRFVHTGEKIESAVITIPASFDTMQASATQKAGKEAGFKEVFLLQEPIAAALAYFNNSRNEQNGYWLVYDLGGGTFDIALVEIREGEMKVKDHEGNNFLGGVDFDTLIVEQLLIPVIVSETKMEELHEQLKVKHGKYEKIYYQLLYLAEELKKELSTQEASEIEFSAEIEGEKYDFYITVTAEQFNKMIAPKVHDTIRMIQTIMERNMLQAADISEIILVGGSTLIPYVRNCLKETTGIKVNTSVDPITAVAVGAAFYAANKYYEPEDCDEYTENMTEEKNEESSVKLDLGYSKMSSEDEEVLLIKVNGFYEKYTYRIIRSDGGFDTGIAPLRAKFTEFLALIPNSANLFHLHVFDDTGKEVRQLNQSITITQGQYSISGQPLPKDICIEVDDRENKTTRLEVVFEKNSILPIKKTLYREISKTIPKGSSDSIIINILEGDRFARTISNLSIGYIEISGKQLTSDLIKGSDIEIRLMISDNRELTVEAYLVMTQQNFNNVFAISEKHVNVSRLKEQFALLGTEIRQALKQFDTDDTTWSDQIGDLLKELDSLAGELNVLKDNDSTDKRYVIAETLSRISQEFDKVGGNERLERLRSEYMQVKELVEQILPSADIEKESLTAKYRKIMERENSILKSHNTSVMKRAIEMLNDLYWDILWNTHSSLVTRFYTLKNCAPETYRNYKMAQAIFTKAEKAISDERFLDLRNMISDLYRLSVYSESTVPKQNTETFKGLGIG